MTDWTPKKGDKVVMTVKKTWGPSRGLPIRVQLTEIEDVTKAGYVRIKHGRGKRFQRPAGGTIYREWHPKDWGAYDYITEIALATEEQIATLPRTEPAGREYAKKLTEAALASKQQKS